MKLVLDDNYTFQKLTGYSDDPNAMTAYEVKDDLAQWARAIGGLLDGEKPLMDQIAGLDGFLSALAANEIEFERPLGKFSYHAGFEYYVNFEVFAETQEQADDIALKLFNEMAAKMPEQINDCEACFKYLEQYEEGFGCHDRIYED